MSAKPTVHGPPVPLEPTLHRLPDAAPRELIDHLCRSSRLSALEAERLILEVLSFYTEPRDDYIRRRHLELQSNGLANAEIFQRIGHELSSRRYPAEPVSARQIRRIIYG